MRSGLFKAIKGAAGVSLLAGGIGLIGALGAEVASGPATAGAATPSFTATCTVSHVAFDVKTAVVHGTFSQDPVGPGGTVSVPGLEFTGKVTHADASLLPTHTLGITLVETATVAGATPATAKLTFTGTVHIPAKATIPATGLPTTLSGTMAPSVLTAQSTPGTTVLKVTLPAKAAMTITLTGGKITGACSSPAETLAMASIKTVPVSITSTSLQNGTVGVAYGATLDSRAAGNEKPFTWALVTGTLPAGLSLAATGMLSGTPTAKGKSTFVLKVTDAKGNFATKPFSITVTKLGAPGYRLVASDGGIFTYGSATFDGSMGGVVLNKPVVGMATDPMTGGYWEAAADGGIFSFNAPFEGSMGGKPLNKPIVGIAADPLTGGYWEVASDGGVFSFNAPFEGSMGGKPLNKPIVGIAAAPTGMGYWEVASDGGIFSFGTAKFQGSTGGQLLSAPVVGIAAAATGMGYWEVSSDGNVFSFGKSMPLGSAGGVTLTKPMVGIASTSVLPAAT
jgi:hypothetical protein